MRTWLVTGGAGFIGSNFIKLLLSIYKEDNVINLDSLTYAGNLDNLRDVDFSDRYKFVKGDICDRECVSSLFSKYDIHYVINFAAESHVDRSIEGPEQFLKTNVIGTQVLLEVSKKYWKLNQTDKYCTKYLPDRKFVQISTDEVYGSAEYGNLFTEMTSLSPNSPYAASKAAADLTVLAYFKTYGLPINITRCSNNYGSHQFPEKLIPLMIQNALEDKELPIYGDGLQIRDWIHVTDHCQAIIAVAVRGRIGEVYNIGASQEVANIDVVNRILDYLNKDKGLIRHVDDRLGHDKRYAIDNSKIVSELGWKPNIDFVSGLKSTIDWYIANQDWLSDVKTYAYMEYYNQMYGTKPY